jgi:hypothetical protein
MQRLRIAAALVFALGLPAAAPAQVNCTELPHPLWLQVGDTQENLVKYLGQALLTSATHPQTLIYVTSGSCTNVNAAYSKTAITTTPKYIPTQAQVPGWTPAMASPTCTNASGGHALDVANAALFVETCNLGALPADVEQIRGPNQAYALVVPTASSQTAITAEEAYYAFGWGAPGGALPWLDETHLFIRTSTKSTLLTWAAAIRVPVPKWHGVPEDSSTAVLNLVSQSTSPEATLGLLGAEVYDANRSTLKTLAFQWFGQHHAWYPDSSSQAFDKKNLRDGHYAVWSPTVWLTHIHASGVALNPDAQYFINLVINKAQVPAFDSNPLDIVIGRGLVPECAMTVTRSVEGGPLSGYAPDEPCGCYYDHKAGAVPACATCSDSSTCGGGACRLGYCEAR